MGHEVVVRRILQILSALLLAYATPPCLSAVTADSPAAKIRAGHAALKDEKPAAALEFYQSALATLPAGAREDRFAATLGLARAAAWLEKYALAEENYRAAVTLASRDEDRAVASAGLAEMLNVADRPRAAFDLSFPLAPKSLANAVQAGRAALVLGWENRARVALESQASNITSEIAETRLGRTFRTQMEEVRFRTAPVLSTRFEYSEDSDGVRTYDTLLGLSMSAAMSQVAPSPFRWDIAGRYQVVDDGQRHTEIPQIQGGLSFRPSEDLKVTLGAGVANAGDWTYPLAAAQAAYRRSDDWGLEFSAEYDAVKTNEALERHIKYYTATIGGDFRLGNTVFAGAIFRQWFSDDNVRTGGVARITSPSFLPFGPGSPAVALQLYARAFENSRTDVVGYFHPKRYDEERLNLLLSTRVSPSWVLRAVAGVGKQSIEGERSSTFNTDATISGQLPRAVRVDISVRHGDSAAFSSSGLGYSQTSVSMALALPLQ